MFCPKCGDENLIDQKYCRRCGHNLEGHRLALEKNLEEIRSMIKGGAFLVGFALLAIIFYTTIAFISSLIENEPAGATFVFAGLMIMLPIALLGLLRLSRAARLLKQDMDKPRNQTNESPAEIETNPLAALAQAPPSVTEHTTLELDKHPQPRERQ